MSQGISLSPEGVSAVQGAFRVKLVEVLKSQGEILPPAASPLGKLWGLFNSDQSSVEDCAEIIKLDPALSARILRVANSAAYNARASSVSEAVLKIGFSHSRQVAFNAGVFERFSNTELPPELNHFWIRNIFVARLAERITAAYQTPSGTEYLAGLFHDVGWLLLASSFREELDLVAASGSPSAEKEILSFTHAEISGAICARSLLPANVVAAVVNHHDPLYLDDGKGARRENPAFLGVILNLCDRVADYCGMDIPWQHQKKPSETDVIRDSPEGQWLSQLGDRVSYDALITQELPKARETVAAFFPSK